MSKAEIKFVPFYEFQSKSSGRKPVTALEAIKDITERFEENVSTLELWSGEHGVITKHASRIIIKGNKEPDCPRLYLSAVDHFGRIPFRFSYMVEENNNGKKTFQQINIVLFVYSASEYVKFSDMDISGETFLVAAVKERNLFRVDRVKPTRRPALTSSKPDLSGGANFQKFKEARVKEVYTPAIIQKLYEDPNIISAAIKKVVFDLSSEDLIKNLDKNSDQYKTVLTNCAKLLWNPAPEDNEVLSSIVREKMEADETFLSQVESDAMEIRLKDWDSESPPNKRARMLSPEEIKNLNL